MPGSQYFVYIRNNSYEIVEPLQDWLSFKMMRVFNGVGRFTLTISADSPAAPLLTKTSGVIVTRRNNDTDARTVIFSGSVSTSYKRTADTITLAGTDDMAVLEGRCRPTPSQNAGPFPDEFFDQTGQASAVLIQLAMTQVGIFAPSDWIIPQFTANADPALGGTIKSRCNLGDRVIDVMAALAVSPVAGGLGFTVLQALDYSANIELQIYAPQDRTGEALFSTGGGTLADYEDEWQLPDFNYVYLGGDGIGNDRIIIEGGNAASIAEVGRRISTFVEARGVTDSGLLTQRLNEVLAGAVVSRRVKMIPFQLQALEYGTDWEMGDLVRFVDADGNNVDRVVRGLEIDLSPTRGAVITPTMGDAGLAMTSPEDQQIVSVKSRVAYLEANYRLPVNSIGPTLLQAGTAAANLGAALIQKATGTYTGNSAATRDFNALGFTPFWVQVSRTGKGTWTYLPNGKVMEVLYDDTQTELTAPIIAGGFRAVHPGNNENGESYQYVAIG